jgi:hypothetical protein
MVNTMDYGAANPFLPCLASQPVYDLQFFPILETFVTLELLTCFFLRVSNSSIAFLVFLLEA